MKVVRLFAFAQDSHIHQEDCSWPDLIICIYDSVPKKNVTALKPQVKSFFVLAFPV